jgi:proteasome accessory factor C
MSRPSSAQRLARLLAIVPWVVAHDGPAVSEVCERFHISEKDLLADLNLLFMCGLYPYTPDSLIEVDVDEGRVWVRFADWFRRPLRLSPPEGLALLAAARAMLAVPAADLDEPGAVPLETEVAENQAKPALARAVEKLGTVLGAGEDGPLDIELGAAAPDVLATLQKATAESRKVVLEYYSFGRDQTGRRVVQPWRVFSSGGHWYLLAWCENVDGKRLFRVDRALSARLADETFEPPADIGPVPVYESRGDDPVVTVDLGPSAQWMIERYPHQGVEKMSDGTVRARFPVSSKAWLERLLLRGGPAARVVEGADGVAAAAAWRVLAIYGHVTSRG